MIRQEPATRWHRFLDAVRRNEVYARVSKSGNLSGTTIEGLPLNIHSNRDAVVHVRNLPEFDAKRFKLLITDIHLIDRFGGIPTFVLDEDVIELVESEQASKSIKAMIEGGVPMKLPHDVMLVEFPQNTTKYKSVTKFVLISERMAEEQHAAEERLHPYVVHLFALIVTKDGRELATLEPCKIYADLYMTEKDAPTATIHFAATSAAYFADSERLRMDNQATIHDIMHDVDIALSTTFVLLHTRGVAQDAIVCEKLNRKRGAAKKALIPKHHVLRLGTVYDRAGVAHAVPKDKSLRTMPVHWRRAHNRRVAYGKARAERRWIHVEACLVNFIEGAPKPALPPVTEVKLTKRRVIRLKAEKKATPKRYTSSQQQHQQHDQQHKPKATAGKVAVAVVTPTRQAADQQHEQQDD